MTQRRRVTGAFEVARQTGSHEVVNRLFVYGTMRQGQTARSLIASQITRCEPASIVGRIYAFAMGHPGFVDAPDEPPDRVSGELLWLTELAATFGLLDAYEGTDFIRVVRLVQLAATGESTWAWIYALSDPTTVKHGELIARGDWRLWADVRR